ncbi:MAG: hypothetical protein HYX75_14055 [Acidobacteria bacterium]|nr:hypothetical protein [Acidobacteriota bacterium]
MIKISEPDVPAVCRISEGRAPPIHEQRLPSWRAPDVYAREPGIHGGVALMKSVVEILASNLMKKKHDVAGLLYTSRDSPERSPHRGRKRDEVADFTGNMFVDYSLSGIDE